MAEMSLMGNLTAYDPVEAYLRDFPSRPNDTETYVAARCPEVLKKGVDLVLRWCDTDDNSLADYQSNTVNEQAFQTPAINYLSNRGYVGAIGLTALLANSQAVPHGIVRQELRLWVRPSSKPLQQDILRVEQSSIQRHGQGGYIAVGHAEINFLLLAIDGMRALALPEDSLHKQERNPKSQRNRYDISQVVFNGLGQDIVGHNITSAELDAIAGSAFS